MSNIVNNNGVGVMLDIETLGTRPGAVVFDIGAVAFDLATLERVAVPFEVAISPASCYAAGLFHDIDTVDWHVKRGVVVAELDGVDLDVGLIRFRSWLDDLARFSGVGEFEFWCRGASFDFPMLEAAFFAADVQVPWMYYHQRCLRTLWKVCFGEMRVPEVVAHEGLADCVAQLAQLRLCMEALRGGVGMSRYYNVLQGFESVNMDLEPEFDGFKTFDVPVDSGLQMEVRFRAIHAQNGEDGVPKRPLFGVPSMSEVVGAVDALFECVTVAQGGGGCE